MNGSTRNFSLEDVDALLASQDPYAVLGGPQKEGLLDKFTGIPMALWQGLDVGIPQAGEQLLDAYDYVDKTVSRWNPIVLKKEYEEQHRANIDSMRERLRESQEEKLRNLPDYAHPAEDIDDWTRYLDPRKVAYSIGNMAPLMAAFIGTHVASPVGGLALMGLVEAGDQHRALEEYEMTTGEKLTDFEKTVIPGVAGYFNALLERSQIRTLLDIAPAKLKKKFVMQLFSTIGKEATQETLQEMVQIAGNAAGMQEVPEGIGSRLWESFYGGAALGLGGGLTGGLAKRVAQGVTKQAIEEETDEQNRSENRKGGKKRLREDFDRADNNTNAEDSKFMNKVKRASGFVIDTADEKTVNEFVVKYNEKFRKINGGKRLFRKFLKNIKNMDKNVKIAIWNAVKELPEEHEARKPKERVSGDTIEGTFPWMKDEKPPAADSPETPDQGTKDVEIDVDDSDDYFDDGDGSPPPPPPPPPPSTPPPGQSPSGGKGMAFSIEDDDVGDGDVEEGPAYTYSDEFKKQIDGLVSGTGGVPSESAGVESVDGSRNDQPETGGSQQKDESGKLIGSPINKTHWGTKGRVYTSDPPNWQITEYPLSIKDWEGYTFSLVKTSGKGIKKDIWAVVEHITGERVSSNEVYSKEDAVQDAERTLSEEGHLFIQKVNEAIENNEIEKHRKGKRSREIVQPAESNQEDPTAHDLTEDNEDSEKTRKQFDDWVNGAEPKTVPPVEQQTEESVPSTSVGPIHVDPPSDPKQNTESAPGLVHENMTAGRFETVVRTQVSGSANKESVQKALIDAFKKAENNPATFRALVIKKTGVSPSLLSEIQAIQLLRNIDPLSKYSTKRVGLVATLKKGGIAISIDPLGDTHPVKGVTLSSTDFKSGFVEEFGEENIFELRFNVEEKSARTFDYVKDMGVVSMLAEHGDNLINGLHRRGFIPIGVSGTSIIGLRTKAGTVKDPGKIRKVALKRLVGEEVYTHYFTKDGEGKVDDFGKIAKRIQILNSSGIPIIVSNDGKTPRPTRILVVDDFRGSSFSDGISIASRRFMSAVRKYVGLDARAAGYKSFAFQPAKAGNVIGTKDWTMQANIQLSNLMDYLGVDKIVTKSAAKMLSKKFRDNMPRVVWNEKSAEYIITDASGKELTNVSDLIFELNPGMERFHSAEHTDNIGQHVLSTMQALNFFEYSSDPSSPYQAVIKRFLAKPIARVHKAFAKISSDPAEIQKFIRERFKNIDLSTIDEQSTSMFMEMVLNGIDQPSMLMSKDMWNSFEDILRGMIAEDLFQPRSGNPGGYSILLPDLPHIEAHMEKYQDFTDDHVVLSRSYKDVVVSLADTVSTKVEMRLIEEWKKSDNKRLNRAAERGVARFGDIVKTMQDLGINEDIWIMITRSPVPAAAAVLPRKFAGFSNEIGDAASLRERSVKLIKGDHDADKIHIHIGIPDVIVKELKRFEKDANIVESIEVDPDGFEEAKNWTDYGNDDHFKASISAITRYNYTTGFTVRMTQVYNIMKSHFSHREVLRIGNQKAEKPGDGVLSFSLVEPASEDELEFLQTSAQLLTNSVDVYGRGGVEEVEYFKRELIKAMFRKVAQGIQSSGAVKSIRTRLSDFEADRIWNEFEVLKAIKRGYDTAGYDENRSRYGLRAIQENAASYFNNLSAISGKNWVPKSLYEHLIANLPLNDLSPGILRYINKDKYEDVVEGTLKKKWSHLLRFQTESGDRSRDVEPNLHFLSVYASLKELGVDVNPENLKELKGFQGAVILLQDAWRAVYPQYSRAARNPKQIIATLNGYAGHAKLGKWAKELAGIVGSKSVGKKRIAIKKVYNEMIANLDEADKMKFDMFLMWNYPYVGADKVQYPVSAWYHLVSMDAKKKYAEVRERIFQQIIDPPSTPSVTLVDLKNSDTAGAISKDFSGDDEASWKRMQGDVPPHAVGAAAAGSLDEVGIIGNVRNFFFRKNGFPRLDTSEQRAEYEKINPKYAELRKLRRDNWSREDIRDEQEYRTLTGNMSGPVFQRPSDVAKVLNVIKARLRVPKSISLSANYIAEPSRVLRTLNSVPDYLVWDHVPHGGKVASNIYSKTLEKIAVLENHAKAMTEKALSEFEALIIDSEMFARTRGKYSSVRAARLSEGVFDYVFYDKMPTDENIADAVKRYGERVKKFFEEFAEKHMKQMIELRKSYYQDYMAELNKQRTAALKARNKDLYNELGNSIKKMSIILERLKKWKPRKAYLPAVWGNTEADRAELMSVVARRYEKAVGKIYANPRLTDRRKEALIDLLDHQYKTTMAMLQGDYAVSGAEDVWMPNFLGSLLPRKGAVKHPVKDVVMIARNHIQGVFRSMYLDSSKQITLESVQKARPQDREEIESFMAHIIDTISGVTDANKDLLCRAFNFSVGKGDKAFRPFVSVYNTARKVVGLPVVKRLTPQQYSKFSNDLVMMTAGSTIGDPKFLPTNILGSLRMIFEDQDRVTSREVWKALELFNDPAFRRAMEGTYQLIGNIAHEQMPESTKRKFAQVRASIEMERRRIMRSMNNGNYRHMSIWQQLKTPALRAEIAKLMKELPMALHKRALQYFASIPEANLRRLALAFAAKDVIGDKKMMYKDQDTGEYVVSEDGQRYLMNRLTSTMFLYNFAEKPFAWKTPLGRMTTQFMHYMVHHAKVKKDIWDAYLSRVDVARGDLAFGTPEGRRFYRWMGSVVAVASISRLFPFSVFANITDPALQMVMKAWDALQHFLDDDDDLDENWDLRSMTSLAPGPIAMKKMADFLLVAGLGDSQDWSDWMRYNWSFPGLPLIPASRFIRDTANALGVGTKTGKPLSGSIYLDKIMGIPISYMAGKPAEILGLKEAPRRGHYSERIWSEAFQDGNASGFLRLLEGSPTRAQR